MTREELIVLANLARPPQEQRRIQNLEPVIVKEPEVITAPKKQYRIGADISVKTSIPITELSSYMKKRFTIRHRDGRLECNGHVLTEIDRHNVHVYLIRKFGDMSRGYVETLLDYRNYK
jgi:hypothetical protein